MIDRWAEFCILEITTPEGEENKVVLVQDDDKPKPYLRKLPGGRRDPGESQPWETAVREVKDETGVTPRILEGDGHVFKKILDHHGRHQFGVWVPDTLSEEEAEGLYAGHEIRVLEQVPIEKVKELLERPADQEGAIVLNHAQAIRFWLIMVKKDEEFIHRICDRDYMPWKFIEIYGKRVGEKAADEISNLLTELGHEL